MSRPLSEAIRSGQVMGYKSSTGMKTAGSKKKGSGIITPGSRDCVLRPKSSITDLTHKEIVSTGMSSCQSNKNMFQSSKLSPKISVGDIKGFGSQSKLFRTANSGSK